MTCQPSTFFAPLIAVGLLACAAAPPPSALVAPPAPAASQAKCGAQEPAASKSAPASAPPPEAARPKTPEEAAARLFTAEKIEAAWFTPSFVDSVPPRKVEGIVADVKKESGAFSKIDKEGDKLFAVLAKGKVPLSITLDGDGRIEGLWFAPTVVTATPSLEELLAGFRALPGKVGVLVLTDGKEVLAHDADVPMAVGSAFKLAVLDALRTRIEAKKAAWSDVVRLEAKHKAVPSGTLQSWPDRAPLTLHTAASLMISQSDNTATDVLLDYVGRDTVEKLAPGNAPFMSTRDAFVLKERSHAPLLARWRAADAAARRKMLPDLAQSKLDDARYDDETPTVDVEWMFTARRLCELMARTKDLDVTRINPGVAAPKDWDLAAYKGGSEAGVLNMTTWVEKAGKKHCVVTTWNDPAKPVEGSKLRSLHASVLAGLRELRDKR